MSIPANCRTQVDSYFVNMLFYFNFNHINHVLNEINVSLDLVLSNIYLIVSKDPDPLLSLETPPDT